MNLTDPRFTDANKAREYLEAQRWPDGPVCPHCGVTSEHVTKLEGVKHRPGVYQCNECREQFTVTVGSVMERSKIPLNKWLMAMHLMGASKKGMSAHQLHRMLGITYQSAWFLCHRIREAMMDDSHKATGGLGGANKVIEVDETYVGGKAKNRAHREPNPKKAVLSLSSAAARSHPSTSPTSPRKPCARYRDQRKPRQRAHVGTKSLVYPHESAASSPQPRHREPFRQ